MGHPTAEVWGRAAAPVDDLTPRNERALRIYAAVSMWTGGASVLVVAVLLPHDGIAHRERLIWLALACCAVGAISLLTLRRVSEPMLYLLNNIFSTVGTVFVWLAVYWSGGAHSSLMELYFFPVLADAYFLPSRDLVWHTLLNSVVAASPLLYAHSLSGTRFAGHLSVVLVGFAAIAVVIGWHKRRLLEAELSSRAQALTDPLTGLHNLRSLRSRVDAAQPDEGTAVLLVDIDDFKSVNAVHGHTGADRLLRAMASGLMAAADERDCVARIGGDEFVLLCRDRGGAEAESLADGCASAIASARRRAGLAGAPLSASVGVARWPQDGASFDELLDAADRAMFARKAAAHTSVAQREESPGAAVIPLQGATRARRAVVEAAHAVAHGGIIGGRRSGDVRETSPGPLARALGWLRARPMPAVVAALLWAGAALTVLLVSAMPGAQVRDLPVLAAVVLVAITMAAVMLAVGGQRRSAVNVVSDVLSFVGLLVVTELSGGTTSPLLPLVFLGVCFAAYFDSVPILLRRLGGTVLVCLSPLVYATADERLHYVVRCVALVSTAVVLSFTLAYGRRALARAQRDAHLLAREDPLTHLLNRRAYEEHLAEGLERRRRSDDPPLCVGMIDLDNFKRVNDTRGHATGDGLLRDIAGALVAAIGERCSVARVGGDEFAFIAPDTDDEGARDLGLRCVRAIEDAAAAAGLVDCAVSATIGCALYPQHGRDADTLVHAADTVLMQAKVAGKRRVDCARARQTA